jgi:hypothetical protein
MLLQQRFRDVGKDCPNAHASFLASAEDNAEKTRLRQEAVATVRQFLGGFREGR